ncbi:histidine phosphatase family protein [Micromonospora sp. DT4]|uniref:histidine phosphatase family protein n=1 Tax=Micromonospora sp. DT4 TaxID=3393438 RepID=UPI003CEA8F2D
MTPVVEAALADCDYGEWTGRALQEIAATRPDALREWLTAPDAAPHGGEAVLIGPPHGRRWQLRLSAPPSAVSG